MVFALPGPNNAVVNLGSGWCEERERTKLDLCNLKGHPKQALPIWRAGGQLQGKDHETSDEGPHRPVEIIWRGVLAAGSIPTSRWLDTQKPRRKQTFPAQRPHDGASIGAAIPARRWVATEMVRDLQA